ncbi:thioesterase superfamily protein [Phlyctema vagabunda]|uniref:Thioesterase superfamily protein n=1 Tax=Phlyctema vagabunda TaxID=108571 RepID=A0ABR4P2A8_9HELO
MAPSKVKLDSPGVAKDKDIVGIPVGEDISAMDRVTALLNGAILDETARGWGSDLFRENLKLISASKSPRGSTTFAFTVSARECNRLGNLHGGCTATIFDICTTTALAPNARRGYWAFAGVSRTLNVTYLRPVPAGEQVLIESEVVHAGKRLCTIQGVMRRASDGAVLAMCEHGKVSIDPEVAKV